MGVEDTAVVFAADIYALVEKWVPGQNSFQGIKIRGKGVRQVMEERGWVLLFDGNE